MILGEFPNSRIIVLTTYAGDVQVLRALKAGACGYLLKEALHREVLETIRAVHAARRPYRPRFPSNWPNTCRTISSPRGGPGAAPDRRWQGQQGNHNPAILERGDREVAGPYYPLQAGCQGPYPAAMAGLKRQHRTLVSPNECPRPWFADYRSRLPGIGQRKRSVSLLSVAHPHMRVRGRDQEWIPSRPRVRPSA